MIEEQRRHRFARNLIATYAALLSLCGSFAQGAATPERPNIVVILADDLGWGSLGCYGAKGVKTPHLDRLATEGRRFTNAYATGSVCSPTRYALLTGRYYWRTSIKDGKVLPANSPLHIETTRTTIASLCREQGYKTAAFGKWHLGFNTGTVTDWSKPLQPGPLEVGFDYFYGLVANPRSGHKGFLENHGIADANDKPSVIADETNGVSHETTAEEAAWKVENIMEALTSRTCSWIEDNASARFMIYFAPNAVHEPIEPHPQFRGNKLGAYGDFIEELDARVGEILATLDRLKLTDRTLVLFTSDNGGVVNPGNENAQAAIRAGLAINGHLRGGKHSEYEGGFREPFIVRWPGKTPAGTVSDQVVCLTDMVATFAELLGAKLSAGNAEDSLSVLRAFLETEPGDPVRDHVVLQSANAVYAYRSGDWKLIERADVPDAGTARNPRKAQAAARKRAAEGARDQLFNVKEDPSESQDLVTQKPEIAARLKAALVSARNAGRTRPCDAKAK